MILAATLPEKSSSARRYLARFWLVIFLVVFYYWFTRPNNDQGVEL
jgi:preprotein translocase subunit YajC